MRHIGASRTTWSNYENGVTEPSIDLLVRISRFFGVSLDELVIIDLKERDAYAEEYRALDSHRSKKSQRKKTLSQPLPEQRPSTPEPLREIMQQLRELSKDIRVLKSQAGI